MTGWMVYRTFQTNIEKTYWLLESSLQWFTQGSWLKKFGTWSLNGALGEKSSKNLWSQEQILGNKSDVNLCQQHAKIIITRWTKEANQQSVINLLPAFSVSEKYDVKARFCTEFENSPFCIHFVPWARSLKQHRCKETERDNIWQKAFRQNIIFHLTKGFTHPKICPPPPSSRLFSGLLCFSALWFYPPKNIKLTRSSFNNRVSKLI